MVFIKIFDFNKAYSSLTIDFIKIKYNIISFILRYIKLVVINSTNSY